MTEQSKQKNVRRWIIPGRKRGKKLLVAVGRERGGCTPLIIKALDRLDEHLTLSIKHDGAFNIHLTKEGNISEHTKLAKGKIDLEKLKKRAQEIYHKSMKPVDPTARRVRNLVVLVPRSLEAWSIFYWRLYQHKGRKLVYPDSARLKEIEPTIEDYFDIGYFDELPESPDPRSLPFGICSNAKGDKFGVFLHDGRNYYMIPISEMIEAFGASFTVESIFCPRCEVETSSSARLCPNCGEKIS